MLFATMLEATAKSSASQHNILTDGQFTATYAELPERLAAFTDYFAKQGIARAACLALECPNTLPGALTLLYLLQQEISFVLLPPSEQGEAASEWKPIPHFCQYRLVVKRAPAAIAEEWEANPAHFLLLEGNPTYQSPADPMLQTAGLLFLRTSGSMGASKLVVHEQDKLIGNARNCLQKYGFTTSDRVVIPVPIAHMYGLGAEFLPAVMAGAAIDLQDKMNLLKYLAREKRFQPTIAFVTPTFCDMLLKGFKTQRTGYKVIVTSGQRINADLFCAFNERVNGCLVNQYGSSEMGAIAACDPGDPVDVKDRAIGQPMSGVQFRIHNPHLESGIGELQCRHPYGFEGYVDENGVWLAQTKPDEWYSTGDLAKPDANGDIYVIGRAQNSVNRSGYLVLFSDIERIMEQFEQIKQVVVVASIKEGRRGQQLIAFCVLESNATLDSQQIRTNCFDRLPNYAVPDDVSVVDSLPLLPSGKVDQRMLQEMAESQL